MSKIYRLNKYCQKEESRIALIIFDYSQEYQIKPLKELNDVVEIKNIILNLQEIERIQNDAIRILLTANSEELLIHYPSDLNDQLLGDLENQFRSFHQKIEMFVVDTVVTIDVFAQKRVKEGSSEHYEFIIIDLLNFNGIDYRSTELGMRRRLVNTFFKGFISNLNIKILEPIRVANSDTVSKSPSHLKITSRKDLLMSDFNYEIERWNILISRNSKSAYNSDYNDEWILIDPNSLPAEVMNIF